MNKTSKKNLKSKPAQAFIKARPERLHRSGGEGDFRPGDGAEDSLEEGVASQEDGEDFIPRDSGRVTSENSDVPEDLNLEASDGDQSKVQSLSSEGEGKGPPDRKIKRALQNRRRSLGISESSKVDGSPDPDPSNSVVQPSQDERTSAPLKRRTGDFSRLNNKKGEFLFSPNTIEVDGEPTHISFGETGSQFLRMFGDLTNSSCDRHL